jgi:ubiquitin-like protein Nedd8
MQIKIKTLTGRMLELNVEPDCLILDLKQKVQEKEGIPPAQIRLIYSGKQLADDKNVTEYGITAGKCINMVLQLKGGKKY